MLNLLYDKWVLTVNFPNCISKEVSNYIEFEYLKDHLEDYNYTDASFRLGDIFAQKHNSWQNNLGFKRHSPNINYITYNESTQLENWIYPIEPWGHIMYSLNLYSEVEYANFFELIPKKIIKDINNDKGLIVINYAHEGWISDFSLKGFYMGIKNTGIKIDNVVLMLNDYNLIDKIKKFKEDYNINSFPKIINYCYYLTASSKHFYDKYKDSNLKAKNYLVDKPFKFLCLNRRLETHRVKILTELYDELKDNSLISFDKTLITNDVINMFDENAEIKYKFDKLPEKSIADTIDIAGANGYAHEDYLIYADSKISIVTETSFYDTNSFISEKVWKPLFQFHPFIIVGKPHLLKYLKEIGFKTFDWLFNEEYDNIEDDNKRMDFIINEIKKVNNLSNDEINNIIYKNFDILEHNHNLLIELGSKRDDIEKFISEKIIKNNYTYIDIYKELNKI
jgi:hypothetical protein